MRSRPDNWYRQSAVIPFRVRDGQVTVLMVTSRKRKRWLFPKGIQEAGLSPEASAVKEAVEEAGVTGEVLKPSLGEYCYRKWGGTCTVRVYAMRVDAVLPVWEEDFRRRRWLPVQAAKERVREPGLQALLDGLPGLVAGLPTGGPTVPAFPGRSF